MPIVLEKPTVLPITQMWKFPIKKPADDFTIEMPKGARVRYVAVQHGIPCIWAQVDPKAALETRCFYLAGTGQPIDPKAGAYRGSFQMHDGETVVHLFEGPQP